MQNTVEQEELSSTASNKSEESKPDTAIKCPFLRMISPDTSNIWRFVGDCHKNGVALLEAFAATGLVVVRQKGWLAFLRGEAPDLYRLDQVRGVSHEDLYLPYLPQVKAKVQALSRNGQISMQDLADIKEWIAAQEGVSVSSASKLETVILFIRAGGELDSGLIEADDALRMIEGYEPKKNGVVTFGSIKQARKLITWSDEAE
jgi:hypothetical protein